MKQIVVVFFSVMCVIGIANGQNSAVLEGKVSFISSVNVYVNFSSTESIALGDTLRLVKDGISTPCLVVENKSSSSCVCSRLNDCDVKKNDLITHFPVFKIRNEDANQLFLDEDTLDTEQRFKKQRIRGRLSGASYSTMSSAREDRHRMMYRLSLNADRINDSKFSLETYLNYRKIFLPAEGSLPKTEFFNVYSLAVRYDIDSTMCLTVGRKINSNASSLGAMDGVQFEKYFGRFYAAALVGFRPDQIDFTLNTDLLQYGAYAGYVTNHEKFYSKSTIGFMQQTNQGRTDREYLYMQHSSTIYKDLSLFSSMELDLFNQINGSAVSDPRLTNFYTSLRYRINPKISVFSSFDSRKSIIFYETFQTDIMRMLDDDESRQGLRFRVNFKPVKYTNVALSYSKRFQSSNQNASDNINGSISHSRLPKVGGRLSVNFNSNTSNYLQSTIWSFRHSRTLVRKKLDVDFYFRAVEYNYLNRESTGLFSTKVAQNYYGAGLSYRIMQSLTFSLLGEMADMGTEKNYRVNARIIKRFDSKRK